MTNTVLDQRDGLGIDPSTSASIGHYKLPTLDRPAEGIATNRPTLGATSLKRYSRGLSPNQPAFHEPKEWREFLAGLTDAPAFLSEAHASRVREVWFNLRVALGPRLPVPQAEEGDDGALKLCWSRSEFYGEIEIHKPSADGQHCLEWFVRDREHDQHDGSEEPLVGALPRAFMDQLWRAING